MYTDRYITIILVTAALAAAGQPFAVIGQVPPAQVKTVKTFVDPAGKSADDLVAFALEHNFDLAAVRREVEAAEAMVRQAGLRANPSIEAGVDKNLATPSNGVMVKGTLPLELFGRRAARVRVAEQELEVRRKALAERERMLAADVRMKFGEALALALRLRFADETLVAATEHYNLVTARVDEGRTAPLEQSMVGVELNRIRTIREMSEGKAEIAVLELKNMIGMPPEEPLKVNGDFGALLDALPPQEIATEQALSQRPDLQMSRAIEDLAEARIQDARANGKIDAKLSAGIQRMRQGFPQLAFNGLGQLEQIGERANVFSVGVMLELPLFNRNQGTVEAAAFEKTAALNRTAFGELTVRREVAAAYAGYRSSSRAMEIYRVGVEKQAETNLDVVRQTYELGSRTLLDYIAEQRRFIEIKDGFIDAQLETYRARVEVLKAANMPELIKK